MDREPYLPPHMRTEDTPIPQKEEEDAVLVRLDAALAWLTGIGICILILCWLSILLVLIGIALGVPGDLFRAH